MHFYQLGSLSCGRISWSIAPLYFFLERFWVWCYLGMNLSCMEWSIFRNIWKTSHSRTVLKLGREESRTHWIQKCMYGLKFHALYWQAIFKFNPSWLYLILLLNPKLELTVRLLHALLMCTGHHDICVSMNTDVETRMIFLWWHSERAAPVSGDNHY